MARSRTERRGGRIAVAALAGLVLALGGAGLAHYVFPVAAPAALTVGTAPSTYAVDRSVFDDAETVQVEARALADQPINLPRGGRISASQCAPGGTLTSGSLVAHVDAVPVLALHTSIPLYRPLKAGDRGDDVTALRAELRRLGADLDETGPIREAVLREVAIRLTPEDEKVPRLEEVPLDRIMWLPAVEVTVGKCSAALGQTIEANAEYATVLGAVTEVRVTGSTRDFSTGEHQLDLFGHVSPVLEDGAVRNPELLAAVARAPEYREQKKDATQQGSALSGLVSLKEPKEVYTVAPAALYAVTATHACILTGGTAQRVNIVSSELGKTFITPEDGGELPATVDAPGANPPSCGDS